MQTAHFPARGILFLLVAASAFAQAAEISDEIKRKHRALVREYLEAHTSSAVLRTKAIMGSTVVLDTLSWFESSGTEGKRLQSIMESLPYLPPREQGREIQKMLEIALGRLSTAVQKMTDWAEVAGVQQEARLAAEKKSRAAAKLLDFQTELIGALSDHHIDTKFVALEPPGPK